MRYYEDSAYIRVYEGVHPRARLWGFFGQCLYQRLELAADFAGVLEIPEHAHGDLPSGVAMLIGCDDVEWVQQHLPKLMDGLRPAVVVEQREDQHFLVLTSYWEAQTMPKGNTRSARLTRKRQQDYQRAVERGLLVDDTKAKTG
jgi:hypothetical protein